MYLPETPATWGAHKEPEPVKATLRSLPDAVNAIIRVFAPIMFGMGILCLVSGGWCFVSSALVIAQGAIWLQATASHASLAEAIGVNKTLAGVGCCGGPFSNLRGLAISGIVFACLEILVALGMGIGVGAFLILTPSSGIVCDDRGFSSNCVFSSNVANSAYPAGIWFTFAAGASVIGGAFNISTCVATIYLLKFLASIASGESNNGAVTPNPAYGVNAQDGP
jgi:hypothetical protein